MVGPGGAARFASKLFFCIALCGMVAGIRPASAQIGSERYASMVIDSDTGQVISAANPDEYRFPASLTKMMTMYMVFEAVRDGRLSLNDTVTMSPWAASMPPTKLGIPAGGTLTVEQALLALVTRSANDVAAALGETLGGNEDRFAELMTVRARGLGMNHTTFRNASGLPDWGQVTTARDLIVLARHLIQDFPQFYHIFSTPYLQFHGRVVMNHQALLRTYPGADGLKTGYTEASGYNVVTSAVRGNTRVIGVVLGARSGGERDVHMAALLDQGFLRLGVAPIEVARHEPFYRLPLIGAARAAPMPVYAEAPVRLRAPRWAGGRGRRVEAPVYAVSPRLPAPPAYAAPIRSRTTKLRAAPRAMGARSHATTHAARPNVTAARVARSGAGPRLAEKGRDDPRG